MIQEDHGLTMTFCRDGELSLCRSPRSFATTEDDLRSIIDLSSTNSPAVTSNEETPSGNGDLNARWPGEFLDGSAYGASKPCGNGRSCNVLTPTSYFVIRDSVKLIYK